MTGLTMRPIGLGHGVYKDSIRVGCYSLSESCAYWRVRIAAAELSPSPITKEAVN
jgi:hypothetical protein